MKGFIKGLITGCIITAAVCTAPVMADNISVLFNEVRINIDGTDRIQWGENIELADGTSMPSSILYNGTTYLPLRKIGELMNKQVSWNGDSKTVSVTDNKYYINTLAEKADANGNVWKYYTFGAGGSMYLGVKDEIRGYERIYSLANDEDKAIRVTDDAIYFAENRGSRLAYGSSRKYSAIVRIDFNSDQNNQDGETLIEFRGENVLIDGDYAYYIFYSDSPHGINYFGAMNYITKESNSALLRQSFMTNFKVAESDDEMAVVEYQIHYSNESGDGKTTVEIKVDKNGLLFNGKEAGSL